MIVDLDGVLVESQAARISPFDGAYLYGDGVFDTLRTYGGAPYRLDQHLARLARETELLHLPIEFDAVAWRTRLGDLLEANDLVELDARVRIQISRGGDDRAEVAGLGPDDVPPRVFVTAAAVSEDIARKQEEGVSATSLSSAFARGNFPQIKSLNYLPSLMAMRFARSRGFDEAILLNGQQRVLEAATSNIFAILDGELRTPSPRLGLLPGITRTTVLELAEGMGLPSREVLGELRDLLLADEVFLTSSVKEILPVVSVDGTKIGDGRRGEWTERLQTAYREDVALRCASV